MKDRSKIMLGQGSTYKYHDRSQAGKVLASLLKEKGIDKEAIVLALPRGGVGVAYEIAMALGLDLDLFIVRKLGFPGHSELAMGALASGGIKVFNQAILERQRPDEADIEAVLDAESKELERRERIYRAGKLPLRLRGKEIILVDDGIATGSTMKAAILAIKAHHPEKIIVAVPVGAADSCRELASLVSDFICPLQVENFYAVGLWYEHFPQTSDAEVLELLRKCPERKK